MKIDKRKVTKTSGMFLLSIGKDVKTNCAVIINVKQIVSIETDVKVLDFTMINGKVHEVAYDQDVINLLASFMLVPTRK